MNRAWLSISSTLFGVARNRRGGVATFLAATIIPLVAFVGLAVDTGRGYLMKTRLNYALDAAALAGGRVMFDVAARNQAIDRFFKANFPDGFMGATVTGPTATINVAEQTLKLDATAKIGTSLMTVLGVKDMDVGASAEVQRQIKGMELALVLDITGSMRSTAPGSSQSKIEDLKDASMKLVEVLYAGRDEIDDFYMAVVPYTGVVNIGQQHVGWLQPFVPKPGEHENNNTPYDNGTQFGYMDASYDHEKWKDSYYPTVWKGCVEARYDKTDDSPVPIDNGLDLTDDPPSVEKFYPSYWPKDGSSYTWHHGNVSEHNGKNAKGPNKNCGDPIQPLIKLRVDIETVIDGLEYWRLGGTIGNQGLVWGWRVISPRWRGLWIGAEASYLPKDYFDDLLAAGAPLSDKAVIMMTDGQNNISGSGYTAYGERNWEWLGTDNEDEIEADINRLMLKTCDAMKDEGIIIYTITFDTESDEEEDVRETYRKCATTPDHYFNSPGEDELTAAFVTIGTQLSNLRLAK